MERSKSLVWFAHALAAMLFAGVAGAEEKPLVDPAYLSTIKDDRPPTSRGMTPAERASWRAPDLSAMILAPPPDPVRAQAEYERNDGLLVRWGSRSALITQMAVAATTLDATARMFVVVTGQAQRDTAFATLQGAGVDMARVEFITQACTPAGSCSEWMRDYGPRFIDSLGSRASVDHVYNRLPTRSTDDAFPDVWSAVRAEPQYDIPLVHGGGNFHLFSNRRAFMTTLIENENAGSSAQQIRDLYRAYQGLDVEIVPAFPSTFDSTQHIDMWVYPVDDNEVIVSDYPEAGDEVPNSIADAFAAARAAEGYTVYRTPGWSSGFGTGTHFTYANSIALNSIVMVCTFSGQAARNEEARAVYAAAFENKRIVQIDCSSIIGSAGAIHCIVMHVPDGALSLLFNNDFE